MEALRATLLQNPITTAVVVIAIEDQGPLPYRSVNSWIRAVPVLDRPRCQRLELPFSLLAARGIMPVSMHIYQSYSLRTLRMRREVRAARRRPQMTNRKLLRKKQREFLSRFPPNRTRMRRRPPKRPKWKSGKAALKDTGGVESSRRSQRNSIPRQAPSSSSFAQVRYKFSVSVCVGYRLRCSVWVFLVFIYANVDHSPASRIRNHALTGPLSPLRGKISVFVLKPLHGLLLQGLITVLNLVMCWKRLSLVTPPLRGPILSRELLPKAPQLALGNMSF